MKKENKDLYVNILGSDYKIAISNQAEMKKVAEYSGENILQGLCDYRTRTIYIDEETFKDEEQYKRILRHELVHAFYDSSGLNDQCDFASSEMNVDWIALQLPKMFKAMVELDIFD